MSEVNNSNFGKPETILEKSVDQNQTQQDNLDALMKKLNHQTAATKKLTAQLETAVEPHAQSTTKGTAREEPIDRSTLRQVSEIVAGIQRDVVHGEEKVAGIVKALEETNITPITDNKNSAQQEDAQKQVTLDKLENDLHKARAEINKLEASNQDTAVYYQEQARNFEAVADGVKLLVEITNTQMETLSAEVETLKTSMAELQASQTNAGSSYRETGRVSPVAKRTRRGNTREPIQGKMSPEAEKRFHTIQRNMKTLILDENDELLAHCTKEYGDVVIDIPSDKWITPFSDLEQELRNMQRQLVTAGIRFADWNIHLSLLCDEQLNHIIRGEDGYLLPWPQAVCEVLRDIDFRDRNFQISNEIWATWPEKGELLRPFFQRLFWRARMVNEFTVFPAVSWRVQEILCQRFPMPVDRMRIQDLDCLRDLEEFVRNYVPARMTYDGSHEEQTEDASP
ncbi:hypothetical protein DAKH74_052180 [Maudiozyma humilis]|uniref:Uncharacterized protein n=1 Tax=Maudiozyma humilis TaxID=51915 RepID=A0AAV5S6M9_MAUHU|nr:hypothetical protein DAKH74_052180 [Kazachstania humilis]